MTPSEIKTALVFRWTDLANPVKLGERMLYDPKTKLRCAQGDALHAFGGWSDRQLLRNSQEFADKAFAKMLGITRFESVVIRMANDAAGEVGENYAASVLTNRAMIFGPDWKTILALFRHIEGMTARDFAKFEKAWLATPDDVVDRFYDQCAHRQFMFSSLFREHFEEILQELRIEPIVRNGIAEILFAAQAPAELVAGTEFPFMNALGFGEPKDLLNKYSN